MSTTEEDTVDSSETGTRDWIDWILLPLTAIIWLVALTCPRDTEENN